MRPRRQSLRRGCRNHFSTRNRWHRPQLFHRSKPQAILSWVPLQNPRFYLHPSFRKHGNRPRRRYHSLHGSHAFLHQSFRKSANAYQRARRKKRSRTKRPLSKRLRLRSLLQLSLRDLPHRHRRASRQSRALYSPKSSFPQTRGSRAQRANRAICSSLCRWPNRALQYRYCPMAHARQPPNCIGRAS